MDKIADSKIKSLQDQTGLNEMEARSLLIAAGKDRLSLLGAILNLEGKSTGRKRKLMRLTLSLGGSTNERRRQAQVAC